MVDSAGAPAGAPVPTGTATTSANGALPTPFAPPVAFPASAGVFAPCSDLQINRLVADPAAANGFQVQTVSFVTRCTTSALPAGVPALWPGQMSCPNSRTQFWIQVTTNGVTITTIYPDATSAIKNLGACFGNVAGVGPTGQIRAEIRGQTAGGDGWSSGRFVPLVRELTVQPPVAGRAVILPVGSQ